MLQGGHMHQRLMGAPLQGRSKPHISPEPAGDAEVVDAKQQQGEYRGVLKGKPLPAATSGAAPAQQGGVLEGRPQGQPEPTIDVDPSAKTVARRQEREGAAAAAEGTASSRQGSQGVSDQGASDQLQGSPTQAAAAAPAGPHLRQASMFVDELEEMARHPFPIKVKRS